MRVLVRYRSMSTTAGRVKNGDIVDLPVEEIARIQVTKPNALEILPELPLEKPAVKKAAPKKAPVKRRAKVAKPLNKD